MMIKQNTTANIIITVIYNPTTIDEKVIFSVVCGDTMFLVFDFQNSIQMEMTWIYLNINIIYEITDE